MSGWQRFLTTVAEKPAAIALRQADQKLSFQALQRQALQQAQALEQLVIGVGDRCILCLDNDLISASLPAALWAIGAIPVFVSSSTPIAYIEHSFQLTEAKALITNVDSIFQTLADSIKVLKLAELVDKTAVEQEHFVEPHLLEASLSSDAIASIVMTSARAVAPKVFVNLIIICYQVAIELLKPLAIGKTIASYVPYLGVMIMAGGNC
ncbi:MAG: AMP-binding protein [Deinococcales bacterium]